jgi:uncharacterized membrane protein YfcA
MVLANAVSASLQRYRSGGLNVSKTAVLGVAALPLAVLGSLIGSGLSLPHFKAGFGLFLLTTSVFVLTVREGLLKPRADTRFYRVLLTVIAAGFFSTLFGIGGGVLMVPALILTAGLEVHRAVATSQLVTFFTAAHGGGLIPRTGTFLPTTLYGGGGHGACGRICGQRHRDEDGVGEAGEVCLHGLRDSRYLHAVFLATVA